MSDRFWVVYKTHLANNFVSMRTGFLNEDQVGKVADELAAFDHVSDVSIERITFERRVKA